MPKGNPYTKEEIERIQSRTAKHCSYCHQLKSLDEFYNCTIKVDGKTSFCKSCKRAEDFRKNYGITVEQFDKMYDEQGGRCAICLTVPKKTLHVDHCHTTGRVRGLLCAQCNLTLGYFKDSVEMFERIIKYLGAQSTETRRTLKSVS